MIIILLQFEYKQVDVTGGSPSPYVVNCVLKKYDPAFPRVFITDTGATKPIYMFITTDHVIQNLQGGIDGINQNVDMLDVGMIHGTPRLRI